MGDTRKIAVGQSNYVSYALIIQVTVVRPKFEWVAPMHRVKKSVCRVSHAAVLRGKRVNGGSCYQFPANNLPQSYQYTQSAPGLADKAQKASHIDGKSLRSVYTGLNAHRLVRRISGQA
jgi:hypothetical protein